MSEIEVRELMPSKYKEWDLLVGNVQPGTLLIQVNGWKSAGILFLKISEFTDVSEMVSSWEAIPFLLRTSEEY